jgi:tripartite-type tricarboxylate transporter receptor subunit TctC
MNSVLADKSVQKKIADQGAEVELSTPAQLATLVKTEVARCKKVVTAAKIRVE